MAACVAEAVVAAAARFAAPRQGPGGLRALEAELTLALHPDKNRHARAAEAFAAVRAALRAVAA
eukprot:236528-Chlamydomonas_euryale.AAC.1